MSIEDNKRTARRFIAAMSDNGIDETIVAPGFTWWTAIMGEMPGDKVLEITTSAVGPVFVEPIKVTESGITAEGNRVALEASGYAPLVNGGAYDNRYHFLLEFDGDGRISAIREHMDTAHVVRDVLPVSTAAGVMD